MPSEATAKLKSVEPILSVRDLSSALGYYHNVLGFAVAWRWGEPPVMASVCREGVPIQLAQTPENDFRTSRIYIHARNIDTLHDAVSRRGLVSIR